MSAGGKLSKVALEAIQRMKAMRPEIAAKSSLEQKALAENTAKYARDIQPFSMTDEEVAAEMKRLESRGMADGGLASLTDYRRLEDMIAKPTMMEKATRMAQDIGQHGLDSVFPLRKVVRTGAEPMMEDWYYRSVMADPDASLQNQNVASDDTNATLFHIKNAIRNKLGMSRFPNKAKINTDDMIHNSFPDKGPQRKAGGGAISADDLILEERPL
jgi:hypothetical protein